MVKPSDLLRTFMTAAKVKMPDYSALNLTQSVEQLRQSFFRASRSIETDGPLLADISMLSVDGADGSLKARQYTPRGAGLGAQPGIVFFHGGGFVLGDLDSHDMICRRLADAARCRVISIDYRLAPEAKFPAAHEDAVAAWLWINKHASTLNLDTERLAVCGDSAGGNLSAFLCQEMNRTNGPMPAFQLLLYPLVQFADIRSKKMPFQESGFFISPNLFDYFRNNYLSNDVEQMDPRVSPLFAKDEDFRGLPPAHVVLCGWDPLKDEGLAYASKLQAFGVPVTHRVHKGMVHGFMNMTAISFPARDAIKDAGEIVGKAIGSL